MKTKFYVASKTKHAEMWIDQRNLGRNIISTWIDEAAEGETVDRSELAHRCIEEIKQCDVLILYCEPTDVLKGALIEVGAALALGKPVRSVGYSKSLSRVFAEHPNWNTFRNVASAFVEECERKEEE